MKNQNESEVLYMHMNDCKKNAQTREDWIAEYDCDELDERDLTAEEAFSEDLNVTLIELVNPMLCESLKELCDTLNSAECMDFDGSSLPTFGGEEPRDTLGVFSWDKDSVLIESNGWKIEKRCSCGEAAFNCDCEN
jgi:hypothetical protein